MLITIFNTEKMNRLYYSIFFVFWLQWNHSCMSQIMLNMTTYQHHHPSPFLPPILNNLHVICKELNMMEHAVIEN